MPSGLPASAAAPNTSHPGLSHRSRIGFFTSDLLAAAHSLNSFQPGVPLAILKSDFKAAYRHCPVASTDLDLADILVRCPTTQTVLLSKLWAMPFGALASVYAWDRLGAFAQHILITWLLLPAARYVDDLFLPDYAALAHTSRQKTH